MAGHRSQKNAGHPIEQPQPLKIRQMLIAKCDQALHNLRALRFAKLLIALDDCYSAHSKRWKESSKS